MTIIADLPSCCFVEISRRFTLLYKFPAHLDFKEISPSYFRVLFESILEFLE